MKWNKHSTKESKVVETFYKSSELSKELFAKSWNELNDDNVGSEILLQILFCHFVNLSSRLEKKEQKH